MSRKRRVLILTEAQHAMVLKAMHYVHDAFVPRDACETNSEGEGDISRSWVNGNDAVLPIVEKARRRDVQADINEINNVLALALGNSCSCVNERKSGHNSDCIVTTYRKTFDRLETLRALLGETL